MSKPTPGPYLIGKPGGPAGPFWSVLNQQGTLVAMQVMSEENAQFIVAAWDLLSACEGALAMLDELFPADIFTGESGDRGPALIAENRARLQATIARAKGE